MPTRNTEIERAPATVERLQAENEELRLRLHEAAETIAAIRSGAVDALVVEEPGGHRIYTLEGADRPYRLFVEEMQQGALTLQEDGTIAWCNRQLADLLDTPQERLLGAALGDFVAPDSHAVYQGLLGQGRTRSSRGELPLRRPDGELVPAFLTFNALSKDGGTAIGVLVTDLTTQRHHEELTASHAALHESERRFREMIDALPVAIYTTDAEGRLTHFNPAAVEFSGRPPELGTDQWCVSFKLYHADGTPMRHDECPMATALKEERVLGAVEAMAERPDGQRRWFTPFPTPLRDSTGKITGGINMLLDITERKQAEEALRLVQAQLAGRARRLEQAVAKRTAELTAINKQLEAFVYSIAHDLRAPLRSMEGFSALLVEEAGVALSDAGQNFARRINRSAQFMDALIQDLLAFSRITQRQVVLARVNPETVLHGVLSRLEKDIQEKQARLDISGPWPAVLAHEPTLGQVLFNLVSNALKFVTPGATPVVRVRGEECARAASSAPGAEGERRTGKWVRVWVEDNGLGIAPEYQEQVFQLFMRLYGDAYTGTGVGLAIVQNGIERMGGRVGVESTRGQGSRFWFELRKA